MLDHQKMLDFFQEYISHYRELLRFENDKLQMIFDDDIEALNKSISKEQALIMKTNAFESKRIEILGIGNEKKTYKQIISEAPYEFQPRLNENYNELSKLIFQIKKINENAQEIVSQRLDIIQNVNSGLSVDTYNNKGNKKHHTQGATTLNKDI